MPSAALVAWLLTLLVSPAACRDGREPTGASQRQHGVREGTWGGRHIGLEVGEGGASVEYDCAHGTVDEPLVLDADGRFEAEGTHIRERPGPIREGEMADGQPARYTGRVDDGTMTLSVVLTDSGDAIGTFTLAYGSTPILRKCL